MDYHQAIITQPVNMANPQVLPQHHGTNAQESSTDTVANISQRHSNWANQGATLLLYLKNAILSSCILLYLGRFGKGVTNLKYYSTSSAACALVWPYLYCKLQRATELAATHYRGGDSVISHPSLLNYCQSHDHQSFCLRVPRSPTRCVVGLATLVVFPPFLSCPSG